MSLVHNLGVVLYNQEQYVAAAVQLREALAQWEATLGADHFLVGIAAKNLGDALRDGGEVDEALALYERSLTNLRAALPEGHPRIAGTLVAYGWALHEHGEPERALASVQDGAGAYREAFGPDALPTLGSESRLGRVLVTLGRHEEAEALLLRAVEGLTDLRGREDKHTRLAVEFLAELYDAWGRPAEAESYRSG